MLLMARFFLLVIQNVLIDTLKLTGPVLGHRRAMCMRNSWISVGTV